MFVFGVKIMSMNGLKSAVLEAGGHIEERCQIKNLPNFTEQYVFDLEALLKFIELIKNETA